MSWFFLIIAGIFEIGFTTSLKLSQGFSRLYPSIFFFGCAFLSFWFLNKAISTIPLGISYAIWTGIGAAGTVCVGIFFFGEHLSSAKIFFLITLLGSILGLKLMS